MKEEITLENWKFIAEELWKLLDDIDTAMEKLLELLEQIKKYSEWTDYDTKFELVLYLDEIHELVIDTIKILKKQSILKAESIRLSLVLEGDDAREFDERMANPEITEEQKEFIKEAIELYKSMYGNKK